MNVDLHSWSGLLFSWTNNLLEYKITKKTFILLIFNKLCNIWKITHNNICIIQKIFLILHLKIGDGHRFRPKSSGQKRQALFPSCESYGQICSVIQSRTSLAPFRTCTYTQVVSKRYAEDIWLIYFCGEYYDEDIINIRTSDSVTDMRKRENSVY